MGKLQRNMLKLLLVLGLAWVCVSIIVMIVGMGFLRIGEIYELMLLPERLLLDFVIALLGFIVSSIRRDWLWAATFFLVATGVFALTSRFGLAVAPSLYLGFRSVPAVFAIIYARRKLAPPRPATSIASGYGYGGGGYQSEWLSAKPVRIVKLGDWNYYSADPIRVVDSPYDANSYKATKVRVVNIGSGEYYTARCVRIVDHTDRNYYSAELVRIIKST